MAIAKDSTQPFFCYSKTSWRIHYHHVAQAVNNSSAFTGFFQVVESHYKPPNCAKKCEESGYCQQLPQAWEMGVRKHMPVGVRPIIISIIDYRSASIQIRYLPDISNTPMGKRGWLGIFRWDPLVNSSYYFHTDSEKLETWGPVTAFD